MGKFWIRFGIGDVTTGRYVEIINLDIVINSHLEVAAIIDPAPLMNCCFQQGNPGDDRDPVIALLAVDRVVCVARAGQLLGWKQIVFDLDLLQAQYIGLVPRRKAVVGHTTSAR